MQEQEKQRAHGAANDEVLTLAEAAAYLRVSEDALTEMLAEEAIPAQKVAGEWRFLKRALADWLRYGPGVYRDFRRYPPPWLFEFPPMEELASEDGGRSVFSRLAAVEKRTPKPGSKEAVLKFVGVFKDDDDLEDRLAAARAQREAGG